MFCFPFDSRNPLHYFQFIYNLTAKGRKFRSNSKILAQKANEIIQGRRKDILEKVIVPDFFIDCLFARFYSHATILELSSATSSGMRRFETDFETVCDWSVVKFYNRPITDRLEMCLKPAHTTTATAERTSNRKFTLWLT